MTSDRNEPRPTLTLVADERRPTAAEPFEPARVTQARLLAGLTRVELAEQAYVSAEVIEYLEGGAVHPDPGLLRTLAEILHVSTAFFTSGRPLIRLDTTDIHFRTLRTDATDRARAVAHAEQIWELTPSSRPKDDFRLPISRHSAQGHHPSRRLNDFVPSGASIVVR